MIQSTCARALGVFAIAAVLAACSSSARDAASASVKNSAELRLPSGWKSETIPFPLDFAPSLPHAGVEVLRFAPGFFDAKTPGYFTYAFAWRIDDAPAWSALSPELVTYFRGLMSSVAAEKKTPVDAGAFKASLEASPEDATRAVGSADLIDTFGDGRALHLEVRAFRTACPKGAVLGFAMAPKGFDEEPAKTALALAREASCSLH